MKELTEDQVYNYKACLNNLKTNRDWLKLIEFEKLFLSNLIERELLIRVNSPTYGMEKAHAQGKIDGIKELRKAREDLLKFNKGD